MSAVFGVGIFFVIDGILHWDLSAPAVDYWLSVLSIAVGCQLVGLATGRWVDRLARR